MQKRESMPKPKLTSIEGKKEFDEFAYHLLAILYEPIIRDFYYGTKKRTEAEIETSGDYFPAKRKGLQIHIGLTYHGK